MVCAIFISCNHRHTHTNGRISHRRRMMRGGVCVRGQDFGGGVCFYMQNGPEGITHNGRTGISILYPSSSSCRRPIFSVVQFSDQFYANSNFRCVRSMSTCVCVYFWIFYVCRVFQLQCESFFFVVIIMTYLQMVDAWSTKSMWSFREVQWWWIERDMRTQFGIGSVFGGV